MSTNTGKGIGRRSFLAVSAGGVALATPFAGWAIQRRQSSQGHPAGSGGQAARSTGGAAAQGGNAQASAPSVQPVDPFFAELRPGTQLDRWTIEKVHPTTLGAVPVTLSTAKGVRFQVDVLKRDPSLPGVGDSHHFSVFVSNSGRGDTVTNEEQGLGAMALARRLLSMESTGKRPALLTLRERHREFPRGNFRVLT